MSIAATSSMGAFMIAVPTCSGCWMLRSYSLPRTAPSPARSRSHMARRITPDASSGCISGDPQAASKSVFPPHSPNSFLTRVPSPKCSKSRSPAGVLRISSFSESVNVASTRSTASSTLIGHRSASQWGMSWLQFLADQWRSGAIPFQPPWLNFCQWDQEASGDLLSQKHGWKMGGAHVPNKQTCTKAAVSSAVRKPCVLSRIRSRPGDNTRGRGTTLAACVLLGVGENLWRVTVHAMATEIAGLDSAQSLSAG